jgi:hypothetical protein
MAFPRKHCVYKGALAKPIRLRPPPAFSGAVVAKRVNAYQKKLLGREHASAAELQRKLSKKLTLLFNHYGIAGEDMAALAWALAFEHVPGFKVQPSQPKSKRGRKMRWDPHRLEKLYQTVQSIKQEHNFTDRQALKFMVNNKELAADWGLPEGHGGSKQQWTETLESRLQDAKHHQRLFDQTVARLRAELYAASMKFRK